ncbi:cytochrome P450 family protein [Streptomyces sp. NPDC002644]
MSHSRPSRPRNLNQLVDPYPRYAALREAGRVVRITTSFAGEATLVTRYEDAAALAGDTRLSTDSAHASPEVRRRLEAGKFRVLDAWPDNMLVLDPPRHTRLRRLVARHFTARRVEALRPFVRESVGELVDALPTRGHADLVRGLALPVPHRVVSRLLGVPAEDSPLLQQWLEQITLLPVDDAAVATVSRGREEMLGYLESLIDAKRRNPGDDLISALLSGDAGTDRLTVPEIVSMAGLLFSAGTETTVHMIGNGLQFLLRYPARLSALAADPSLVGPAVEELLRLESPITLGLLRYAACDLAVGETVIPKGDLVIVGVATANHDHRHFSPADEMDLSRQDRSHLTFGKGPHYCLGAPLARLELGEVFGTLVRRYPRMRLAVPAEDLVWGAATLRGLEALPVRLSP